MAVLTAAVIALAGEARAAAPAGRYVLGPDTVRDVETGLTWQRAPAPSKYTWSNAKTYCDGLVLAGAGGWRLPNVRELRSLVDVRSAPLARDTTAFPGVVATELWWTSTPLTYNAAVAWLVEFGSGSTGTDFVTAAHYVRCVR